MLSAQSLKINLQERNVKLQRWCLLQRISINMAGTTYQQKEKPTEKEVALKNDGNIAS